MKENDNHEFKPNEKSQECLKPNKSKNNASRYNKNLEDNNKRDYKLLTGKSIKTERKIKSPRRNKRNLNNIINYNPTMGQNISDIKDKNNEFSRMKSKNIIIEKPNFQIFDLSSLFIMNNKIDQCYNYLEKKLKQLGYLVSRKNNIILCNKNGLSYRVSVIKLNNADKFPNDISSIISLKVYGNEMKKNNKFSEIIFKNTKITFSIN